MKIVIWGLLGLLAGLWTAAAFVASELTQWAVHLVMSGASHDLGHAAAQWPVPSWIAVWVDPAWAQALQEMTRWTLAALSDAVPFIDSALGWLVALVWVIWVLGMMALLAIAVVSHWLSGRSMPALRRKLGGVGVR